jgi:hypothetical protein
MDACHVQLARRNADKNFHANSKQLPNMQAPLALQLKDQDIVNSMNCVNSIRSYLLDPRENGWDFVLHDVHAFCEKHDIAILEIEVIYHYQVDCFNAWFLFGESDEPS